jgi:hypothetical protein
MRPNYLRAASALLGWIEFQLQARRVPSLDPLTSVLSTHREHIGRLGPTQKLIAYRRRFAAV